MSVQIDDSFTPITLQFLKRCFKFVDQEWRIAPRETLPDKGFEIRFRENYIRQMPGWSISHSGQVNFEGQYTASGLSHEISLISHHPEGVGILEMQNDQDVSPGKNDIIVFFAKVLDYVMNNPLLAQRDICPVFVSSHKFEEMSLSACLSLGIHPVAPGLRPLPLLVDGARRMGNELNKGLLLAPNIFNDYAELCGRLNKISSRLQGTWLSNRCGYQSDSTVVLRSTVVEDPISLSHELKSANEECSNLLAEFRTAKMRSLP